MARSSLHPLSAPTSTLAITSLAALLTPKGAEAFAKIAAWPTEKLREMRTQTMSDEDIITRMCVPPSLSPRAAP